MKKLVEVDVPFGKTGLLIESRSGVLFKYRNKGLSLEGVYLPLSDKIREFSADLTDLNGFLEKAELAHCLEPREGVACYGWVPVTIRPSTIPLFKNLSSRPAILVY